MGCAFTVDDLAVAVASRDASIGVATVYRAVSAMEAERLARARGRAVRERALRALRLPAGHHHHHLICTGCGRLEPADCPLGTHR